MKQRSLFSSLNWRDGKELPPAGIGMVLCMYESDGLINFEGRYIGDDWKPNKPWKEVRCWAPWDEIIETVPDSYQAP